MTKRIVLHDDAAVNPIDVLSEIEIYKTQSVTERDFCIGLTLRFESMQVACDSWAYSVISRLKEATVQIATENASLTREGRTGDAARPGSLAVKNKIKIEEDTSSSKGGQIEAHMRPGLSRVPVPSLTGSLKVGGKKTSEKHASETYSATEVLKSIEAISGKRWRIKDVIKEALGGKYEPDEYFCKIQIDDNTMSGYVKASLYFYPRDLIIDPIESEDRDFGQFIKIRPNNIAVAKALLAKHLRSLNGQDDTNIDGRIVIGQSKVRFTVEEDAPQQPASRNSKRDRA